MILIVLFGFNLAVWLLILFYSNLYPIFLGLAILAYGFGLRHAVDADHIAVIDNITRKLINDGKKTTTVGFFFSLGHSMVVIALSILIIFFTSFVEQNLPAFKATGSIIGQTVSSLFLLLVGIINLLALTQIFSKPAPNQTLEEATKSKGILTRILRPFLKIISQSWQMFFVGLLFGLGLDTATEIGLLSISAVSVVQGIPFWVIMLLPLVFTAGMMLIDTLDGILMLKAYGWAYLKPERKLYYNFLITLISSLIALSIGGMQLLSVLHGLFRTHI